MPASALSAYIRRVRGHASRLSRAQEKRLARRVRTAGDRAAARTLVSAHLNLVVKIARNFRHLHPNLLDLIQEGNLALVRAVHCYDPDRPVTVAAYVACWVRTYIARFILADRWEPDLGDGDGHDDSDAPPPELDDPQLAMFTLTTEDDAAAAPDLVIEARQDQRRLAAALPEFERQLTPRERNIFRARLIADRPATLTEKGMELGLSAERVRQIENGLTQRLRAQLADGGTAVRGHGLARAAATRRP